MLNNKTCIVLGGSSQAGSWLVPSLIERGWTVHLVSRGVKPQVDYGKNALWHNLDLRNANSRFSALDAGVVFDTIGIGTPWLERLHETGAKRAITFSSTSVFTKVDSSDPVDIEMIRNVRQREASFSDTCARLGIAWTILRPTLIYGGKFGDRTVNDISRVIRLFGFFPVF
jgi:nucleoside-diphosphate-sugar epimerase